MWEVKFGDVPYENSNIYVWVFVFEKNIQTAGGTCNLARLWCNTGNIILYIG